MEDGTRREHHDTFAGVYAWKIAFYEISAIVAGLNCALFVKVCVLVCVGLSHESESSYVRVATSAQAQTQSWLFHAHTHTRERLIRNALQAH